MHEKIKYNGEEYRVGYQHEIVENNKKIKAVTTAYIKDADDNVIAIGKSVCSKKDQFSKKLGRTIAKGRMLKVLQAL